MVTSSESLVVPSPSKLRPGILKGGKRKVVHGTPGDVGYKQRSSPWALKSWCQLEKEDAQDRRLWRDTVDGLCS